MSDSKVKLDPTGLEAREVDGEIVILDLHGRRYLGGNSTATTLWPLLVEGTSRSALTMELERTYGIDGARARRDTDAFVESLASLGLLSRSDPPANPQA